MAKETDILILCSKEDNIPLAEGEAGWVTNLQRFLELMVLQVLGEEPTINLVTDEDSLKPADLKKAGLMIALISPHFLNSGKCVDAVAEFRKAHDKKKDSIGRVFKVVKSPAPDVEEPKYLADMIPYDMYLIDDTSGDTLEINDFFGPDAERNYWMKMVDLAYDIEDALLHLKEGDDRKDVKPMFSRKAVYLAETSHDLVIQRNIIRRELQRHGYRVLPDHTLPDNVEEFEQTVKKELGECNMSIHLIGSAYGDIPKGSDRSVVDLQNKIASELGENGAKNEKLSRLIWISPDIKNTSEKQRTFIENVKRDISTLEGAEILQTPLEDFKNIIREELIQVSDDKKFDISDKKTTKTEKKKVYVVYDLIDKKEVTPLIKFIEKSGYEVIHPSFEGNLLELREKHIQNLVEFDFSIVFQGKVNTHWVRMKLLDSLKAPGFGRNKPVQGRSIVSAKGVKINTDIFGVYEVELFDGEKDLPLDDIKKFLETK